MAIANLEGNRMTEHRDSSQRVVNDKLTEQRVDQESTVAQPRVLTAEEVTAVAGGPTIQNDE